MGINLHRRTDGRTDKQTDFFISDSELLLFDLPGPALTVLSQRFFGTIGGTIYRTSNCTSNHEKTSLENAIFQRFLHNLRYNLRYNFEV